MLFFHRLFLKCFYHDHLVQLTSVFGFLLGYISHLIQHLQIPDVSFLFCIEVSIDSFTFSSNGT